MYREDKKKHNTSKEIFGFTQMDNVGKLAGKLVFGYFFGN
jgi:hypothetical protein